MREKLVYVLAVVLSHAEAMVNRIDLLLTPTPRAYTGPERRRGGPRKCALCNGPMVKVPLSEPTVLEWSRCIRCHLSNVGVWPSNGRKP